MQALADVADLVGLADITAQKSERAASRRDGRPALAITFDDDLPSHVEHALPVLRELHVPATFFLSGRALHGLGAYWFQDLEALFVAFGPGPTAALLDVPERLAKDLPIVCERNADLRRRVSALARNLPPTQVLGVDGIASLGAAGMTIGFHTLEHQILPELDDATLEDAVSRGREELARAAGRPVCYFAYPHGKVDTRSASAVRHAGFTAAFTGVPRAIRLPDDPYDLGRWEPGPIGVDDLLVKLAARLLSLDRPSPRSS
jgi:peptidoglycan/xylan/chitin deacetylase (PgdA/CDA1 family)